MFDAYKIGVSIHLTNHVSAALASIGKDAAKTEAQVALLQKRLDSIKTGLKGGLLAAGAGFALAAMFKPAIDDALKFERAMLRLKDIGGITPKVVMQVRDDALRGKYKGIDATESVDLVRDLHAAFGDAKEALEFMPLFAGMARVTQGKYGKSAVAGEEDVRALAKVAERRGGTKSPAAMEAAMDLSMKMMNASGGAVTPKDLLAFMARMGAMGNAMSNNGILKMWALMQEQGGSKAGTALNSAMQNLVNGRGTEGSGNVLRKLGWVDEAKNEEGLKSLYGANWSKHLNKVTANSLKNVDGAKEDMVGWVQSTGLPLIEKYLDKKGIADPKKREGETVSLLAQALSNRLGADSIALIATQLPRILKDYNIATESKGLRDSIKSFDENPAAKIQDLHATFKTALVNLGESALPVVIPLVNRLASAFKSFNEYAQKNPETIKSITKGILGIAGALVVLGGATVIVNGVRALGLAVTFFGRALVLNPIGLIVTGIGVAAFLLWKNWSTIQPKLESAWASIKAGWIGFIDFFIFGWAKFKSFLPNFMVGNLTPTAAGVPPSIRQTPVVVNHTTQLDGRTLFKSNTYHAGKALNGPQFGTGRFDGGLMPSFAGGAR